ncbi:hypothetical protein BHM03_00051012 [Ensete ventricosum]|nr:hypothetical protein BHM03_00051012 [Ensete ventricosum]
METTLSSLAVPFGPCPDRIGVSDEAFVSYLEEDFCPTVGLKRELARKLSSNFLVSESKEKMNDGISLLYHIWAEPLRVVKKARHIRASEVS